MVHNNGKKASVTKGLCGPHGHFCFLSDFPSVAVKQGVAVVLFHVSFIVLVFGNFLFL